jgi:uncharacterized protein (DUF302 family)
VLIILFILAIFIHDTAAQAHEIIAWSETLSNEKQQAEHHFRPASLWLVENKDTAFKVTSMQHTIISTTIMKGVTMDQSIIAMRNKASELDVPEIPKQHNKPAEPFIVIDLTFCTPRHISRLIKAAPEMAVYDPCRVTLIKTPGNRLRLMTVNLDVLINGKQLPPDAQRIAIQVNQDMLAIVSAGANPQGKHSQPQTLFQH